MAAANRNFKKKKKRKTYFTSTVLISSTPTCRYRQQNTVLHSTIHGMQIKRRVALRMNLAMKFN
jgi:predicted metal-binding protein